MNKLEAEFNNAMMNLYRAPKEECDYNATYFLNMLFEHGGVETARRMLAGPQAPQYGFTKLYECERLDITVECVVLNRRFQELFEDHELDTAHQRLREYNFDPDRCEKN